MALTALEKKRLAQLQSPWLSSAQLEEIVGVNPQIAAVKAALSRFATVTRREAREGDAYSRTLLELWLQDAGWVSVRDAALRVGMNRESFLAISKALEGFGVQMLHASQVLASEKELRDIYRNFASLRRRIFADHSDMCRRLHTAVRDELNIAVEPVYCWVSAQIQGAPRLFSYYRCSVTDHPVSIKHAIPINTGKSPRLLPDHVNRVTLESGYDELVSLVLGSAPSRDQLRQQLGRI